MLFHTWSFALFFAVVLAGFFALGRTRYWMHWVLGASYAFYAFQTVPMQGTGASADWWRLFYLGLVILSTALDFQVVNCMARLTGDAVKRKRKRKQWLAVSLVNNLGLLAFFKYALFFRDNANALLASMGLGLEVPHPDVLMPPGLEYLLPVGISFYTFQSMSYTIDFYRGKIDREPSFLRFATFVAFFPQLVAGPIERSSNLLPQFRRMPQATVEQFSEGASLFLVGLFKKVACANYLSLYVERIYSDPGQASGAALMLGTFCFAWQIYFDFSGYTDMARGVARFMGFRLMLNFNHPYLATGLSDFWGRWHISLSTWFRDYVYVPLGGNRLGEARTCLNLFIVFVISGIWHGAAWTFVIWGLLHAIGTIATRALERSDWYRDHFPDMLKRLWVFTFVLLGWVFFRAESLDDALLILRRIFTTPWTDPECPLLMLSLIFAVWIYQFIAESKARWLLESAPCKIILAAAMILYLMFCSTGGGAFIYFQF
ncbi:MAG: MBOAT family protein [Verrucomicrobia bacterium]|nr:MBOAT family protein [Verrucomicrobiota bacterium]